MIAATKLAQEKQLFFFGMLHITNSEVNEFVASPSLNPYLHRTDIPVILWGSLTSANFMEIKRLCFRLERLKQLMLLSVILVVRLTH